MLMGAPTPGVLRVLIGGNGQGKSAIAKAIFVCCGAERGPPRERTGVEGTSNGAPQRGSHAGSTTALIRSGERPRLYEYIREYWSEGGPPKAMVSLTFSNFSSAGAAVTAASPMQREAPVDPLGGPPTRPHRAAIKEEGEGLISRVSKLTGDAFIPLDRAFCHAVFGDYITLTREITKKKCSRKQQQQQQQEGEGEGSWATGSSTWYLEGHGGSGGLRREAKASEIRAILSHFGFDMANPAVYLSQDLAKTFLFRASEQSLYKFFLCASG